MRVALALTVLVTVLGYLQKLTGGTFDLDVPAARAALDEHVGKPLGLDTIASAHAVYRLVNAHMADAMRVMSSEAALSPAEPEMSISVAMPVSSSKKQP